VATSSGVSALAITSLAHALAIVRHWCEYPVVMLASVLSARHISIGAAAGSPYDPNLIALTLQVLIMHCWVVHWVTATQERFVNGSLRLIDSDIAGSMLARTITTMKAVTTNTGILAIVDGIHW
jgi:hypothetical protein